MGTPSAAPACELAARARGSCGRKCFGTGAEARPRGYRGSCGRKCFGTGAEARPRGYRGCAGLSCCATRALRRRQRRRHAPRVGTACSCESAARTPAPPSRWLHSASTPRPSSAPAGSSSPACARLSCQHLACRTRMLQRAARCCCGGGGGRADGRCARLAAQALRRDPITDVAPTHACEAAARNRESPRLIAARLLVVTRAPLHLARLAGRLARSLGTDGRGRPRLEAQLDPARRRALAPCKSFKTAPAAGIWRSSCTAGRRWVKQAR